MVYPTRSFRLLEYHGNMLSDGARVAAFARAIAARVRPGARVLDLGTGSGFLALLAARAGAERVDAVEIAEIIDLARRLVRHNHLDEIIQLHRCLSYQLGLPRRAEVLVTETLGNFGLEEGIMGAVLDARTRLLEPGAAIIPERVRLFARPLYLPDEHRKIGVFFRSVEGIDFSEIGREAASLLWYVRFGENDGLGPPSELGEVDLRAIDEPRFFGRAELEILRDGTLHGLGGTFEARLSEGVTLTNEPGSGAVSWRQAFLPLADAWPVRRGDRIEVEVETWDNGEHWRWAVRSSDREAVHSTLDAYRSPLSGLF